MPRTLEQILNDAINGGMIFPTFDKYKPEAHADVNARRVVSDILTPQFGDTVSDTDDSNVLPIEESHPTDLSPAEELILKNPFLALLFVLEAETGRLHTFMTDHPLESEHLLEVEAPNEDNPPTP